MDYKKWGRYEMGAQAFITDEMTKAMGFDGNTKVSIQRDVSRHGWTIDVLESFLGRRLKHIEYRYVELPKWLDKLIPRAWKKKHVIDISAIKPLPEKPNEIVYWEYDTYRNK
jgi:hypothetical protein